MRLIQFANVLLLNKSGEALILRRTASHPTRPLSMDLPGGGVEDGESFESAAIRELNEEIGFTIALKSLMLVRDHWQQDGDRKLHGILYAVQLNSNNLRVTLSDEHDAYYWLRAKDILGLPQFHQESVGFAIAHGILS